MNENSCYMITPGIYLHFKGGKYEVIGVAKHSESLEEYVVYRHLDGEPSLWIRPLAMFEEQVEVNGESIPRFMLINGG